MQDMATHFKRRTVIISNDYILLNRALLLLFCSFLIYPVLSHWFGLNPKSCGLACPSCGLTRDMYGMLVNQNFHALLNSKSPIFFVAIGGQVALRFFVAIMQLNNPTIWFTDLLLTSLTLGTIFFSFTKTLIHNGI